MEQQRLQDAHDDAAEKSGRSCKAKQGTGDTVQAAEKNEAARLRNATKRAQEEQEQARLEMLPHLRSRVDYRKQLLDEKSEERKPSYKLLLKKGAS